MKKIALALLLLPQSILADIHVYQCEMSVAETSEDNLISLTRASYGAMVVDSGDQFYVLRDDRILSSPTLTRRNGKLTGTGGDNFVFNKFGDIYGVHAENESYLFDDCKEIG
ncbi:hypothetical protein AB6I73_003932 [Citrobacter amalonaticus]